MQVQYGTYTHPDNECTVVIARQGIFDRGICTKIRETWTIDGIINIVDGQDIDDISGRIAEIETAYATHGLNVSLIGPSGPTSHALTSDNCLGGTRIVVPPSFPKGDGTEYATIRTFSVVIEGDILTTDGNGGLMEFRESLEFTGGGPRWVIIETRRGLGVRQQVSEYVPYRVRQSGQAVGVTGWPNIPAPLWPANEHQDRRVIVRSAPERVGPSFTGWPVTWSYEFESTTALTGLPTKR